MAECFQLLPFLFLTTRIIFSKNDIDDRILVKNNSCS